MRNWVLSREILTPLSPIKKHHCAMELWTDPIVPRCFVVVNKLPSNVQFESDSTDYDFESARAKGETGFTSKRHTENKKELLLIRKDETPPGPRRMVSKAAVMHRSDERFPSNNGAAISERLYSRSYASVWYGLCIYLRVTRCERLLALAHHSFGRLQCILRCCERHPVMVHHRFERHQFCYRFDPYFSLGEDSRRRVQPILHFLLVATFLATPIFHRFGSFVLPQGGQ